MMHIRTTIRRRALRSLIGLAVAAAAAAAPATFLQAAASASAVHRLPFECGSTWNAATYSGHAAGDKALDFNLYGESDLGEPVLASKAGTVLRSEWQSGFGWIVEIDHGVTNGIRRTSFYAHLEARSPLAVGSSVAQGAKLGTLGGSGGWAPHLHYEQRSFPATRASTWADADPITFNGTPVEYHYFLPGDLLPTAEGAFHTSANCGLVWQNHIGSVVDTGAYPWIYIATDGPYWIPWSVFECWVGEGAPVVSGTIGSSEFRTGLAPSCQASVGGIVEPAVPFSGLPTGAVYKGDRLERGEQLCAGEYIAPDNLRSALYAQHDENIVLIIEGKVVFEFGTNGLGLDCLRNQAGDGNLVGIDLNDPSDPSDDRPVWDLRDLRQDSHPAGLTDYTQSTARSALVIRNDGALIAMNDVNSAPSNNWWHSHTGGRAQQPRNIGDANLDSGTRLRVGEYIHNLASATPSALGLTAAGETIVWSAGMHIEWVAGTGDRGVETLNVQASDGNVVWRRADGTPVAHTRTYGKPGAFLRLGNDQNVVVYVPQPGPDEAVWHRFADPVSVLPG